MQRRLPLFLAPLLLACFSAQAQDAGPTTARDALLDDLLDQAAAKERLGDYEQAVRLYLELETKLERRRSEKPNDRPTTEVGPGVDRGIGLYLRDRISKLPPEAQERYRLTVDPRAKLALERALASGEPEQIEGVIARYPLSSVANQALETLASRSVERAELGRALRALRQVELRARAAEQQPVARRAALRRALVALIRGEGTQARAALAAYQELGGKNPELAGKIGQLPVAVQVKDLPQGFDPGGIARRLPLELPELPDSLAESLAPPPAYQDAVLIPERGLLLVSDSKTIRAVRVAPGAGRAWSYSTQGPDSQVSRLEALTLRPAVGAGRVFVTLHRNRPAKLVPAANADDPPKVERQKDWRVVALDLRSGERLWDAATDEAFQTLAREAEWVSPPLFHEGGVYVAVSTRQTDLRVRLVRLDPGEGEVVFDIFLASRTAYDFLGVGSPLPAPTVSAQGQILVATGIGAVAAVDPASGDVDWVTRYPAVPQGSQGALIQAGRRFAAQGVLGEGEVVLAAPVDAGELIAIESDTGEIAWTAPRGEARYVCARGEHVFLLGRRLEIRSRADGRLLVEGPALPGAVTAPPLLLGEELLAVTRGELLRVGLADGALRARWRFADPTREVGTPVLLPSGEVATLGYAAVQVFQPLERALRAAQRLEAGERELALGLLHASRTDPRQALRQLERAVRSGLTQTRVLSAQRAGIQLMETVALERLAAGKQDGFRVASEHAFAFLGPLGLRQERVLGRAQLSLLRQAAPLLVRYGDVLAKSGDAKLLPKAGQAFQRLLSAPPGARVPLGGGAKVEASHYAALRLREMVAEHGDEFYAKFRPQAKRALELARSASDRDGLQQVIERWPASPEAREARWELAELFRAAGLARPASDHLEAFLREYPSDPRLPEALARLALAYQATQRAAEARDAIQRLCALEPEPSVRGEPSAAPQPAQLWARPLLATLLGDQRPDQLAQERERRGLDLPLLEVYRSPTVLEMRGPELVEVDAPRGMNGRVLLREGDTLALLGVPEGDVILRVRDAPRVVNLDPAYLEGKLIVPTAKAVEVWSAPETGEPRQLWKRSFALGGGRRLGPNPVHRVYVAKDSCVVLTGDNQVAVHDLESGRVRWKRAMPIGAGGGLLVGEEQLIAISTAPPALAGVALADGGIRWQHQPRAVPGRNPRLSLPRRVGSSQLAYVYGGKDAVLLDATKGQELWRKTPAGEPWLRELRVSGDGRLLVARTQVGTQGGLLVLDTKQGGEAWRDDGRGAQRNGQQPPVGVGAALVEREGLFLGEETLYTFRDVNQRTELWAQDLRVGTLRWRWSLPIGARGFSVIETPTAVLVPNSGMISSRLQLDVLVWGTGRSKATFRLSGRQLVGAKAAVSGGSLVLSGEKGIFAFARSDEATLQREAVELARAVASDPKDALSRTRLANRLQRLGRSEEALELLQVGLLAEGLRGPAFDRLFEQLAIVRERHSEQNPLALDLRRITRPPEIDGELNDWWRDWSSVDMGSPRYVLPVQQKPGDTPGRWSGREDLSAKLYLGYDETYFYFALDVNDMHLRPYDSEAERWIGDCLLIAIDCRNDGGEGARSDDVLLSLALTLPKKKDEEEEDPEQQEEEASEKKPEGRYFVHRKEDKSGAIYEVAIPWALFAKNGAQVVPGQVPPKGFTFGLNVCLTDDDGDRADVADPDSDGRRGALKVLELTPGVLLHYDKSRLWKGYIPKRFAKVRVE